MAHHPFITGFLLGTAVALCLICALGLAAMRDPFQRLQSSMPVTSVAIALITVAIWLEDSQWQSRVKAALIALVLFAMNAILSHATARAIRLRRVGHWPVASSEHLPLLKDHGELSGSEGPVAQPRRAEKS